MHISLFNVSASDDQVQQACAASMSELARREVSLEDAFYAALNASDVDHVPENPKAVAAWFAMEAAAMENLFNITGKWPHFGVLIALDVPGESDPAAPQSL